MNLRWFFLIAVLGCSYSERIGQPSKRTVRTRRLKPSNAEIVPEQIDPWPDSEPSCEQLRRLWLLSRRQARAAEITNEIPTFHDPFIVGEQYLPSTEPPPSPSTEGRLYGKIVYTPRDEPIRQRPIDQLRSFVSGSRSQRRLAYVDSNRFNKGIPRMDDSKRLYDDRMMATQPLDSQTSRGGFDRLRDVLRSPSDSFPIIRRPDNPSRSLASYGSIRNSPSRLIPYLDPNDEFSEEDNERLINMIKRYETNKKKAAVVKKIIQQIQELPPREKQILMKILEERSENQRRQRNMQRERSELEEGKEALIQEFKSSARDVEDTGLPLPAHRGRRLASASGNQQRPEPLQAATRTFPLAHRTDPRV